jgi:hypothetical protein
VTLLFRQNVQKHLAASTPKPKENVLQQSQRKEDLRMTKVGLPIVKVMACYFICSKRKRK